MGSSYGLGADDGVTAWGFLRCRRWCDGLGGCSGLLRDFFLAGPLAGWVPHAPRGVAGAAPEARLRTQTFEVLRAPLGAVYTVGPGSWTPPGPHNQLPVWIFFCYLLSLGCRAGGGGGGRGCGGRTLHRLWPRRWYGGTLPSRSVTTTTSMYVTASPSTRIPTYLTSVGASLSPRYGGCLVRRRRRR